MAAHWDWALRTAMDRSDSSHFSVHYDRKITKPGHLRLLFDVLGRFPSDLVTWTVDLVVQTAGQSVVWQAPWDGRFHAIQTSRVVEMTTEGRIIEMGQAFPVLSNCAMPRAVLDEIRRRFGNICDSTGPDSCFTYRFCATHDRYVHFDRPVGIIYASHRSAGGGLLRGSGGDFGDFTRSLGERPWLDAAPIPGFNLGQNMLFHEYELVRRSTDNPAFRPIERDGYLSELARALQWLEDPQSVTQAREVLQQHGWKPPKDTRWTIPSLPLSIVRGHESLLYRVFRRLLYSALIRLVRSNRQRRAVLLFMSNYLKIKPPHICGFEFDTDDQAVRQTLLCPRIPVETNLYLEPLQPAEVTMPARGAGAAA